MNVRPARPEDARRIAEIHVETWRDTYPGVIPQEVLDGLSVDERERLWQEWIPHPETRAFVAELDGGVVGFVTSTCWTDRAIGELDAIYVAPAGQGQGAGLGRMQAGAGALAERWDEAILWVATENPRARRVYERYGWAVDGERIDDSIPGASVPRRGTGCPAWASSRLAA